MNPYKELELMRNACVVQAIAIEQMNEWLRGEGGEDWVDSWCEAIALAHKRYASMSIAQRRAYSSQRSEQFRQWLGDRPENSPNSSREVA